MGKVTLAPMQWADVKNIDNTRPIDDNDYPCLKEIRDVLRKYKMQNRLGVALLHSHFDLEDDEALLETTDGEKRELILKPVQKDVAANGNIGTIFQLKDGDISTMGWCRSYCERVVGVFHFKEHNKED